MRLTTTSIFGLTIAACGALVGPSHAAPVDGQAAPNREQGAGVLLRKPADWPDEARVQALLARMSLPEKLALIHGAQEPKETYQGQAGFLAGVPRLGIPSLRLADGPLGVLTRHPSAAPPSTMAIAAMFDRATAQRVGEVIGRNARARGIDVVLEPYVNLYRDPTFGRAYNTFGEDPVLTGQIGAAIIRGVQDQGVMAQVKHLIGYEGADDAIIGPQALHEVYLAPFADAIAAGVSSIMCSYNKLNTVYTCGSADLLSKNLRQQLGFTGYVTSDWGATHGAEYVNAGLDMEMPGEITGPLGAAPSFFSMGDRRPEDATSTKMLVPPFFDVSAIPEEKSRSGPDKLPTFPAPEGRVAGYSLSMMEALSKDLVKEASINEAAARVLRQIERFGFLDGRQKQSITPEPIEQNASVLREAAAKSAVLLKNDGILPLAPATLADAVLIGPGAVQTFGVVAEGEKALGYPERQVGVSTALQREHGVSPAVAIAADMVGVPVPATALRNLLRTGTGLERRDDRIDFTVRNGNALPADSHAKWAGELVIPREGEYDLNFQIIGGVGKVLVDGRPAGATGLLVLHGDVLKAGQDGIIPTPDGLDNVRRRLSLSRGSHRLEVEVEGDGSGAPLQVRLAWITPEQRAADRAAAVVAARRAKVAVVFAWSRGKPDPFGLAGDQDALIADVSAANPNTVVVLNTGEPVALPWMSNVRAVLQMWYTGDEGGWATADLLTGKISPAGRLPFTWPKRLTDLAALDPAFPERKFSPDRKRVEYSEGVLVGYRWFDQRGIEPTFPFGFGLSYSRFGYSDLEVRPSSGGRVAVSFTVANEGSMKADEVPQVYLGAPDPVPSGAQFAKRALVAFDRVTLAPGERRRMTLEVPAEKLRFWSEKDDGWKDAGGRRPVWVGASSRDLRLSGVVSGRP